MTISEFIQLLEVLIWPFTLLAILLIFRPQLVQSFERLKSLQGGPGGVSLTFDNLIEKAKDAIETNKPGALATAKSGGGLAFAKAYETPSDQLLAIKKSLDDTIHLLAKEKGIPIQGKTSPQLINELSSNGALRKETVEPLKALLTAVNAAPLTITQNQVNQLQSLHDAL